jgi:membrane protein insertase Oxa1/YidC/SpoIIIJ
MNTIIQSIIDSYSDFFLFLASILGSAGLGTIFLSILAALLMTGPLRWAGKVSEEEGKIQSVIQPQIQSLKENKQGSDQHSSINRLYSRYSYRPIFAVRSLMPLFIQLPFLILTYFMFVELKGVEGESFLWITDLSKPDNTFPIKFGNGNILPFIMLFVNVFASLFLVDFNRKGFMQALGVSLLFFLILYNNSSILLIFWTFNNFLMLFRGVVTYSKSNSDSKLDFDWLRHTLSKIVLSGAFSRLLIFISLCSIIFKSIFSAGILYSFTQRFFYLGIALFFLSAVINIYKLISRNRVESYKFPSDNYTKNDILLTLLPLTFIVQYGLLNGDVLMGEEFVKFIGFYAIAIVVPLCLVLPVLNRFMPTFGFFPFLLSFMIVILAFPVLVTSNNWEPGIPDIAFVIALLSILFLISMFLFYNHRKSFLVLSLIMFSTNTIVTLLQNPNEYRDTVAEIDYTNFIANGEMTSKPDIYLLTFDSYVPQETMMQYGIDNSSQEAYLKDKGFELYPHAYSLGGDTRTSMSRVLEMTSTLKQPSVYSTAGNALVPSILNDHGYHTYGILSPYWLTAPSIGYDTSHPAYVTGSDAIYTGVNQGEFKFDLIDTASETSGKYGFVIKKEIMTADTDFPKFMYTHTGPWHSQNSGKCAVDEIDQFESRLKVANNVMKEDIEDILSTNRDSIIIINGDHGPYLTGDCHNLENIKESELTRLHLQDRYGAFLAIKWPDSGRSDYIKIRTIQDAFEAVFGFLFQDDKVLQERVPSSVLKISNNIPDNAISDGKINVGIDKGEDLYESEP